MNLPDNRKTKIFRLLYFEFLTYGNGNDDDVPKLPKESFQLENFRKVSMALVSINELLILLSKR